MDIIRQSSSRRHRPSTARRTALPAVLLATLLLAVGCMVEEPAGEPGGSALPQTQESSTTAGPSTGEQGEQSSDEQSSDGQSSDGQSSDGQSSDGQSSDGQSSSEDAASASSGSGDDGATAETSAAPSAPGLPAPEELDADGMERSEALGAYFSEDEACMAIGSTLDGLRTDMDGGLQSAEDLAGAHEAVEQTYRMVPASLREPFAAVDEALGDDVESMDRQAVLDALRPVEAWMEQTCDGEYHSQDEGAEQHQQG